MKGGIFVIITMLSQALFAGEVYIERGSSERVAASIKEKWNKKEQRDPKRWPCKYSSIAISGQTAYIKSDIRSEISAITGADNDGKLGGMLYGMNAEYEYKKPSSLYVGVVSSFLTGEISDRKNTLIPDRDIWDVQGEGRFGYHYQGLQGKRMEVTPYIGFGYNFFRQVRNSTATLTKRTFNYYKYYMPVGFEMNYHCTSYFHGGLNFKWFPDVDASLETNALPGTRLDLFTKNLQILVEVPMQFLFGCENQGFITFTPYWQKKKMGGTKKQTLQAINIGVPAQTEVYWGGSLYLGYRF